MKRRAGTMTLTTQREVQTPGVGYFVSKLNFIDSLKQRNDGEDEDDEKDEQKQEGNKSREDENDADFIKVVKSFLQRVPNQEVNDHHDKNKLKKKVSEARYWFAVSAGKFGQEISYKSRPRRVREQLIQRILKQFSTRAPRPRASKSITGFDVCIDTRTENKSVEHDAFWSER
jgi:hypothetical protein